MRRAGAPGVCGCATRGAVRAPGGTRAAKEDAAATCARILEFQVVCVQEVVVGLLSVSTARLRAEDQCPSLRLHALPVRKMRILDSAQSTTPTVSSRQVEATHREQNIIQCRRLEVERVQGCRPFNILLYSPSPPSLHCDKGFKHAAR